MSLQEDLSNLEVLVDFILDGQTAVKMSQGQYRLTVYANPTFTEEPHRVDDFVTAWPCAQDSIVIQVRILIFSLEFHNRHMI